VKLLIVESPGKIKTLRKILGPDWILEASVGHTTELASDGVKNLGFEIENNRVVTRYVPRAPRGYQVLSKLRAAVKQADQVYLAMDPDREGEAIAWHLVEQLHLKKFVRVAYTQITDSAVKAAINAPRGLDFPLIHAQRARQCLDKLVGFEVSPLLWNTTGGKSAGRVQSATLHLVCDRERERLAFVPKDYWTLHSHYDNSLIAQYEPPKTSKDDAEAGKVNTKLEAETIEKIARTSPHVVNKIEDREEKRLPPPPLITSSLQQMAGVRLKFNSQKTMKIAQELYEGVGGSGLITYMRTDAVTLSPEFIQEARSWLSKEAPEALAAQPPTFRTKADSQGAHEAIRPTSAYATPEKLKGKLNSDQLAVYRLIWERAIASQCRPARLAKSLIEIKAANTLWIARGSRVVELGYLRFWRNIEDDRELPVVQLGQVLNVKDIKVEKKTTQPPSRYSEAKLVQLMEKLGIGRPSTYASTIATLKDRDYIYVEKDVLAPTALGMSTDQVLSQAIPDLVDVAFTANMENSLDQIAEDKMGWEKFLNDWNFGYFREAMSKAQSLIRTLPKFEKPEFRKAGSSRTRSNSAKTPRTAKSGRLYGEDALFEEFSIPGSRMPQIQEDIFASGEPTTQDFNSNLNLPKVPRAKRTRRKSPVKAGSKASGRYAAKTSKKPARPRRTRKSASAGTAPDCQKGHGAMEARISKKGDPYFKCPQPGCDSWHWPN
jgi:DNA topoisomerase-1